MEPVKDYRVKPEMTLSELIEAFKSSGGFMATHVAEAVDVLVEAIRECDLRFLSFTANLIATGLRGVIAQIIREGLVDVIVTTCGALDHDIARSFGGTYYKGYFEADDTRLYEEGYHRLGNVFIPVESYGPIVEKAVYKALENVKPGIYGGYEIIEAVASIINDENSWLKAAHDRKIPVIVPGITDGAFGTALLTYTQLHPEVKLDILRDEKLLADKVFHANKLAALIIGGGISKHHVIWWSQFKEGLDYAVYITTAVEWDGSLSGAMPREAVSWGKIKPKARKVVVYGDATVVLPLIVAGVLGRLKV